VYTVSVVTAGLLENTGAALMVNEPVPPIEPGFGFREKS
jgi:hypothetical protein